MDNQISRRNFIKAAGAVAGVLVATRFNPRAYAANEKVSLASIGVGNQGTFHLQNGLGKAANLKVVAVCDVYSGNRETAAQLVGPECRLYADYKELLDKEKLDGVVIATPFYTHYPIVMDCLDKGIHVFCEKTMCQTIDQCRDVVKKCNDTGLFVQVGHQRRYNPKYNKALWLMHNKSILGRVNHMTAQWHRNSAWRKPVPTKLSAEDLKFIKDPERHFNWRLYQELSGGLMTELATHQLDVANWIMGGPPARVTGLGGINYWRDGRDVDDNVSLVYEWDIDSSMSGYKVIKKRDDHQDESIDLPYSVAMTYSSICANSKMNYSEHIYGDQAAFDLSEGDCRFFPDAVWNAEQRSIAEAAEAAANAEKGKSGKKKHGKTKDTRLPGSAAALGLPLEVYTDAKKRKTKYDPTWPNLIQFERFANDIMTKGTPKANQTVGLHAAIAGLKGIEALSKRGTVEIDPALSQFDFTPPDAGLYEEYDGPIPGQKKKRFGLKPNTSAAKA
jgi:predicted dehydrogenase